MRIRDVPKNIFGGNVKRKSTIAFFYVLAIAAIIGFESYKNLLKPTSSEDISELQIISPDKISEAVRIQNKQRFLQKGYKFRYGRRLP